MATIHEKIQVRCWCGHEYEEFARTANNKIRKESACPECGATCLAGMHWKVD